MNEWEFVATVASWINEILNRDPDLAFSEARCEQKGKGTKKRRDVTLYDRSQVIALTGEVKLPYHQDGESPYNTKLPGAVISIATSGDMRSAFLRRMGI